MKKKIKRQSQLNFIIPIIYSCVMIVLIRCQLIGCCHECWVETTNDCFFCAKKTHYSYLINDKFIILIACDGLQLAVAIVNTCVLCALFRSSVFFRLCLLIICQLVSYKLDMVPKGKPQKHSWHKTSLVLPFFVIFWGNWIN